MPYRIPARPLAILVLFTFVLAACNSAASSPTPVPLATTPVESVIRVGITFDNPPFESKDAGGQIIGFDRELMDTVARVGGLTIEYQPMAWRKGKLISEDLVNGKLDLVIAAVSITPERQKIVDFSLPYFEAGQALIAKQSAGITSPNDLNGQTVAVLAGTTGEQVVREQFPATVVIQAYDDIARALADLNADNINAVVYDSPTLVAYIADNPGSKLTLAGSQLTSEQYGIAVRKDQPQLLEKVNKAIEQIRSSGELQRLIDQYFPGLPQIVASNPTGVATTPPASDDATPSANPLPAAAVCVDGSDTVLGTKSAHMTAAWSAALAQAGIELRITASGSEAAPERAKNDECVDVLIMSEQLNSGQLDALKKARITVGEPIIFGNDVLAFVTDSTTSVEALSLEQATAVLTGTVTDWLDLGAPAPQPIKLLLRPGSGTTNHLFIELLGWEPFVSEAGQPFPPLIRKRLTTCESNEACLTTVAQSPGAFYWASRTLVEEVPGVRVLPITTTSGTVLNPLDRTLDLVTYPPQLLRPLYVYTLERPTSDPATRQASQQFVDYLLGAGQETLITQGFYRRSQ